VKSKLNLIAALAALSALPGAVHGQQCTAGYVPVSLDGRTTTMNISATRQAGQICLVMTKADGREIFDDCGALVGNITSQNLETGTSTLNHTAVFELTQSFQSEGDVAQITGVLDSDSDGAPCAFSVTEHVTKLKWGTGTFAGATIDAVAVGTISFCPGKNHNTFQLTGQACVRPPRR
jgi:hypothetical protein